MGGGVVSQSRGASLRGGSAAMSVIAKSEAICILEKAGQELQAMVRDPESAISAVAAGFEELAGHTDGMVGIAAAVVGCVENENVLTVLPKVQALGAASRQFIQERLEATARILETVTAEAQLLGRISELTRR